ncbi:MAG: hypothetical protein GX800_02515, partial [Clostridiaceae bacterium]|nr:hypothetical protein [Clostridiaceae bacterium]
CNYSKQYSCEYISEVCLVTILELQESHYIIKKCGNCGKYFIPYNRADTIYCDNISPQDDKRTCKEYGSQKLWYDKLKQDEAKKLYRNIYMAKQMQAKRYLDIPKYAKNLEKYKTQSKQLKKDVKEGKKSEAEYIEWLKNVKEKKV